MERVGGSGRVERVGGSGREWREWREWKGGKVEGWKG